MSLWKFNGAEFEVDFTDAAFMENYEKSVEIMEQEDKHVLKVGKMSEIIRSQCQVYFNFFDNILGKGSSKKMFGNKVSVDLCVQAANSLYEHRMSDEGRYKQMQAKYFPEQRGGNRAQRRAKKRR